MRTAGLLLLLIAFPFPALAGSSPITKATSGECVDNPEEALANLAGDIENARLAARAFSSDCVKATDSQRSEREKGELERIVARVEDAIDLRCQGAVCVNNAMAVACALRQIPETKCFGGCSKWSIETMDAIEAPQYFTKERVQQCALPGGPWCHWVVELTNPRTGEKFVLDSWAKKGGAAYVGDSSDTPLFDTVTRFNRKYPYPKTRLHKYVGSCIRGLYNPEDR